MLAIEAHNLGILRSHVDNDICGNALLAVLQPLEQVGVRERAHAHGTTLVVDLAVGVRDLELAHELRNGSHGARTEQLGGRAVDHGHVLVVDLLDVLGKIALGGIEDRGVALGIAGHERLAHEHADKERQNHAEGQQGQTVQERGMAHGAQGPDLEPHHCNDGDEDNPAPHTGAVHVERRMEPPVAHRGGSGNRHEQDDEGATAPLRHALHERGNGDIRANARRAARPFGLCAGGLLALASGMFAFASRFPAVTGGRARLRRCASPRRGTIALGVASPSR